MPETDPTPRPDVPARRNRLWGRLLIVALGLLVAAYIIPLFRH
jgi:hypothetical protein